MNSFLFDKDIRMSNVGNKEGNYLCNCGLIGEQNCFVDWVKYYGR